MISKIFFKIVRILNEFYKISRACEREEERALFTKNNFYKLFVLTSNSFNPSIQYFNAINLSKFTYTRIN